MHLCEGWVWENAYSSLKSVETPINLCIILFDNHSHVYKSVFGYSKYILGDVLDTYVQKFNKNIFCKNLYFALECIYMYSFLPFNFVICHLACEYIYSLKHIPFTYFRSIP